MERNTKLDLPKRIPGMIMDITLILLLFVRNKQIYNNMIQYPLFSLLSVVKI